MAWNKSLISISHSQLSAQFKTERHLKNPKHLKGSLFMQAFKRKKNHLHTKRFGVKHSLLTSSNITSKMLILI